MNRKTYKHIDLTLKKLFDQYHRLKSPGKYYAYKAQPLAVYYPGMDKFVPTMSFICLVSIFDEALGEYIENELNIEVPDKLERKLKILEDKGLLKDAQKLHNIRKLRNTYAHEPERYSNWEEFEDSYDELQRQLKHLEIIA